jgi:Protein of unknown function (DUF1573)
MKQSLSIILILFFTFHTEGYAQTASKTVMKAKIQSKSVSQPSKPIEKKARIKFVEQTIDLGTIKEDVIIEKFFEFKNEGAADLVIINAEGSCGCTVPTIPMEPIKPGEKGRIGVKYTAKNKAGPQKPIITVTTNGTPALVKLQLECWVNQIPGGVKE